MELFKIKELRDLGIMVLAVLCLLLVSCGAGFVTNAGKTLDVGATIYESGYPMFLDLHKKGLITDAQKAKGYDLAVKYWAAYHAAQTAHELYAEVDSAENKDKVTLAMQEMAKRLAELTAYIQPLIKEGN